METYKSRKQLPVESSKSLCTADKYVCFWSRDLESCASFDASLPKIINHGCIYGNTPHKSVVRIQSLVIESFFRNCTEIFQLTAVRIAFVVRVVHRWRRSHFFGRQYRRGCRVRLCRLSCRCWRTIPAAGRARIVLFSFGQTQFSFYFPSEKIVAFHHRSDSTQNNHSLICYYYIMTKQTWSSACLVFLFFWKFLALSPFRTFLWDELYLHYRPSNFHRIWNQNMKNDTWNN